MKNKFEINSRVRIIGCQPATCNNRVGTVVGYHGDNFPIVMFDIPPADYNPAICIIDSCLELI